MTHKLSSSSIRLLSYTVPWSWVPQKLLIDVCTLKFQCVISVQPDSEDGHFYLGRYYDRLKSVLASDRLTKSAYVVVFFLLCLFCMVVSKLKQLTLHFDVQWVPSVYHSSLWACTRVWEQIHLSVYATDALTLARFWINCSWWGCVQVQNY